MRRTDDYLETVERLLAQLAVEIERTQRNTRDLRDRVQVMEEVTGDADDDAQGE